MPQVLMRSLWDITNRLDSDSTYASMVGARCSTRMVHAAWARMASQLSRVTARNPSAGPTPGTKSISIVFSGPSNPGRGGDSLMGAKTVSAGRAAAAAAIGTKDSLRRAGELIGEPVSRRPAASDPSLFSYGQARGAAKDRLVSRSQAVGKEATFTHLVRPRHGFAGRVARPASGQQIPART